jgi:hypothetical protein
VKLVKKLGVALIAFVASFDLFVGLADPESLKALCELLSHSF